MTSHLEETLLRDLRYLGVPEPVREYRFDVTRRWRFDAAWPDKHVAVECEGGVFVHGRHSRGVGMTADCEKYSQAAIQGWRVIRVTGAHIKSGQAQMWVRQALGLSG